MPKAAKRARESAGRSAKKAVSVGLAPRPAAFDVIDAEGV